MDSPRHSDPHDQEQERPLNDALGLSHQNPEGALPPPATGADADDPPLPRDQPMPGDAGSRDHAETFPATPEIPRPDRAANDESLGGATAAPTPAIDAAFLSQAWDNADDPPVDQPHAAHAKLGKLTAIRGLVGAGLLQQTLVDSIVRIKAGVSSPQAPGGTVVPMARRTEAHGLYVLAIEVGARVELGKPIDSDLLCVFGIWLVRRMLNPQWMPPASTVARVRAALVRPEGRTAQGWQTAGRQRAVTNATHALQQSIEAHPKAAAAIGLRALTKRPARASDPLSVFGRAFRRRVHNLRDFASMNHIAGAAGYGSLSKRGLREAGQRLRERVHAGEALATHMCLQVLSHLPSHTLKLLPIRDDDVAPDDDTLAWMSSKAGTYNYRLFHLMERGARPAPGAEGCYELTTQVVSIDLSPFLAEDLLTRARSAGRPLATEQDLLGEIDLHPQADIEAGKGYKVTVRRVQESVPIHLLQEGLHRWPVALATNSQFVLSRGRPAYSVCRASAVMHAVNAGYELLGWPTAKVTCSDATLIGSFVTPRAEAVSAMLNGLAERADRHRAGQSSRDALMEDLNAHAGWVAAVMALCLALRKAVVYEVVQAELAAGIEAHVDDKHVHAVQGPPVPVAGFLQRTIVAWQAYCLGIATRLDVLGDTESLALAHRISDRVVQTHSTECVFVVGLHGQLVGVGTSTWHTVLPPTRALQNNFGRHFWPFHLMESGVAQLAIDVVMRHQIEGLPPAGSNTARSRRSTAERLRQAMDAVITRLGLYPPEAFGHD